MKTILFSWSRKQTVISEILKSLKMDRMTRCFLWLNIIFLDKEIQRNLSKDQTVISHVFILKEVDKNIGLTLYSMIAPLDALFENIMKNGKFALLEQMLNFP